MQDSKIPTSSSVENIADSTMNRADDIVDKSSLGRDVWRRLKKNKAAIIGLVIITLYFLVSVCAPVLPIYSFRRQISEHRDLPPSVFRTAGELWLAREKNRIYALAGKENRTTLNAEELQKLYEIRQRIETDTIVIDDEIQKTHERIYLLGTDHLGRDMLSRIIYGGQVSIAVGLIGTITSVLIGIFVGAMSGYIGGKTDYFLMRFVDIMYGLPYMLVVIILMAILGRSIFNLYFALSLVGWLVVARVVRGQVISLKNREFIEAAKSMGASTGRIVLCHLLPNTAGVIIIFATIRIPAFIMQEAFLSFLGLGISAPFTSWGSLASDAVERMNTAPWQLFFPALAMTLFLFAMNFLGDGLRDAFDQQGKNKL